MIQEEEFYEKELEIELQGEKINNEMDESVDGQAQSIEDTTPGQTADRMDVDSTEDFGSTPASSRRRRNIDPTWTLQAALGTEEEQERWKSGDIAGVYEDTLRMLLRLQGESGATPEDGAEGNALATTVGKVERAGRAAEVVETMMK
jgi:kinetochor protein Mis14/NSL1